MTKFIPVLVFFLAFPDSANSRTLSQLITDARVLATDNGATRQRFSDGQITQLLNEGQRQAISVNGCMERSFQFTLVGGQTYYSLPTDYLSVRRVTRGYQMLSEQTPAALDSKSNGWEEASGTPSYYVINFSSASKMQFVPWPTTADTDTIRVDYFAQPADMSASSDVPFDGITTLYAYHNALPYYAASRMASLDNRNDVSVIFLQQYATYVDQMKTRCKARDNYMPSVRASP